ncbi:choline transporter, putative [Bodo saltans]|uniref:Choline transporter-like protein n=1 Tax=Bodo saltans TaxID=75058 RepID=A0A0S4KNE7_BODSA|nr:choline transporter, putative [Bodo saltans]|eukprot:CUI14409.1 choline transporter, putative [Bodo saltans]
MCGGGVKEVNEDELKDGAILQNRSCTDICCIFIFGIFLVGWIVVIAVAFANGHPEYIVRPTNYNGQICGVNELVNYSNYYVPLPQRYTYGFCVATCPGILDYVCNNDFEPLIGDSSVSVMNTYYDHTSTQYLAGVALSVQCQATSCTAQENATLQRYYGLIAKSKANKCFAAVYVSGVTLYRCLPFGSDNQNATLMDQMNATLGDLSSLADKYGVGSFFTRGFSESKDSWVVILICCLSCAIFALIWIFLLRWILAPIVYLCVIAVFLLLIALGYLSYRMQSDYADVTLPGDTNSEDQQTLWKVLMYTSFALAAVYLVLMLWLIKRIRIAIIIMEEASKAFLSNPGMVIIPPFTCIMLLGIIALFVVVAIYIQTIGSLTATSFEEGAISVFGASAVNMTEAAATLGQAYYDSLINATNSSNTSATNATTFDSSTAVKGMHAMNFFMLLWTANFFLALGFFIMALVVCAWYFSATAVEIDQYENNSGENGRLKYTNAGTLCRAVCVAFRYHLGTLFFGSLLIAIIQFIRAVMLYIEKNYLAKYKDNATVKLIIYCINCWLACIERIIKIISYNAFIVCAIKNQNFLSSAADALALLTANIIRVSMLEFLATAACFLIKLFICCCNMILAYFLLQQSELTDGTDIESGLFPLFFILIISFAIASLFVNVFECCVDTILMCFFVDEDSMKGLFMPPSLAKLVDKFTHIAEAREKYEQMVRDADKKASVDL